MQGKVAHYLRQWPSLRRFAFTGDLDFCSWSYCPNLLKMYILDHFPSPSRHPEDRMLTVEDIQRYLRDEPEEYRLFKLDMLEFLGLPQEEELDLSTEVMPIWEERHEEEFAVAVRYMAKLCPSLQEFVWYFGGVEQEYKLDSWRWKIHRNKDGSLNQVSGKLFWPESCRPPFPSFREFALVGEERRRAEEHGWPRTAFSEQFPDPRT